MLAPTRVTHRISARAFGLVHGFVPASFMFTSLVLAGVAGVVAAPVALQAQVKAAPSTMLRPELDLNYTWVRSNLPPGGCGCFALNGGGAEFAVPLRNSAFSLAAAFNMTTPNNASPPSTDLTLSSYTVGGRYRPAFSSRLQPFGEVLVGIAHASGPLVAKPNPASANASLTFASMVGGGVDLRASPRFSVRLVQADYYLTTFDNGSNDHQNNLRLSVGTVFHF